MTQRGWAVLAAWVCFASPCAADIVDVDSRVAAVTVFPDRADVVREAKVKLSKGAQALRIAPLPAQVDPASVTARGTGEAAVTLHGVRVETSQRETAQDPKVQSLEKAIEGVARRQDELRNTRQVLEQERRYLQSIQAASGEQISKDLVTKSPDAEETRKLLEFLDESFLKNFERDQAANVELDDLSKELDKLQRELAQLEHGRRKQETAVIVEMDVQDGGAFVLQVSYRVPGATWQPTYVARAAAAESDVELASYALVRQGTGEDWHDVRLTLSTAKPAIAGSMPELQPWFLRPWEPQPLEDRVAMKARPDADLLRSAMSQEAGEEFAEDKPEREAQVAYATVAAQGPAVTFELPSPESIPSDWQPHKVPISSQRFAAELAYEATPRLTPYAFLRAKVVNATQAFLLAGQVSVFLDGAFVATADLKQVAPEEEFDLYLGVDERVKVERKQLKERVEVSLLPGLRGKMKSTDYEYLTTIQNYTGRSIGLTVFDQYPVSEREEITVESLRMAPEEVTKDPEKPGVFHWAMELVPGQKAELTLAYRVRHPVDLQVQ